MNQHLVISYSQMCGSATVAQRRHVGLQLCVEAIAATTHGFLGPNKRPKFIQDEDAGDAMRCWLAPVHVCLSVSSWTGQTTAAADGTGPAEALPLRDGSIWCFWLDSGVELH